MMIPVSIFAETKEEIQQKKSEAEAEQKEVKANKSALLQEIESLSSEIAQNEEKLTEINSELIKLNEEIKQLKNELEEGATEGIISNVQPNTTIEEFISNIETKPEVPPTRVEILEKQDNEWVTIYK